MQSATTEASTPVNYLDLILDQWDTLVPESTREAKANTSSENANPVRKHVSPD